MKLCNFYNTAVMKQHIKSKCAILSASQVFRDTFRFYVLCGSCCTLCFFCVVCFKVDVLIAQVQKPLPISSANVLNGRVRGVQDKLPIAGARVFIANTMIGAISATDGTFRLVGVPSGKQDLVVSAMGYQLVSVPLGTVTPAMDSTERKIEVLLNIKPVQMGQVNVTTRRKPLDTTVYLRALTELLLGVTENARLVKILNPQVFRVSVEEDEQGKEVVTAGVTEPLVIENKALGYKLTYYLQTCGYTSKKAWYEGFVWFEQLIPLSTQEEWLWGERRKKAYYGSTQHFLRALAADSLLQEGFTVRRVADVVNYFRKAGSVEAVQAKEIAAPTNNPESFVFAGAPALEVVYERANLDLTMKIRLGRSVFGRSQGQASLLEPKQDIVLFNPLGHFEHPREVSVAGYMSYARLADQLPATYYPTLNN
jgi:hypothetical protein